MNHSHQHKRAIRVVLVSPSDVQPERDLVPGVVEVKNSEIRKLGFDFFLELFRYEIDARPGLHPQGPQAIVDAGLQVESADLVVGVFWKRFGTTTATGETGTEHEVRLACKSKIERGAPEVMLYFSQAEYSPTTPAENDQLRRLLAFKSEMQSETQLLTQDYSSTDDFRWKLAHDLTSFYAEILPRGIASEQPVISCRATAAPRLLRPAGLTEPVGDLILSCDSLGPHGVEDLFDINLSDCS